MIFAHFIWYSLWAAPHAFQIAILVFMVRRRLIRSFPAFFFYTIFEILQFGILAGVSHFYGFKETYLRVYSIGLGISTALRFGIIQDILEEVFRNYPLLNKPGKVVFRGAALFLIIISIILSATLPGSPSQHFMATIHNLDRSVSILQCGLLLTLFWFARYFNLSLRTTEFGIALGLGVFASTDLMIAALRQQFLASNRVPVQSPALDLTSMAVYLVCVLMWLYYVAKPKRDRQMAGEHFPENDLEQWNRELQQLLQR